MKGYKHILVGVDFSVNSRAAAIRGASLARQEGAALTLVHVIEHFPQDIPIDAIPPEDVDPAAFYLKRARSNLAKLASDLDYPTIGQEVVMSSRSANYEIVNLARTRPVDLIVVGANAGDAIATLGSTAMAISHHAPCDVLVVRAES